MIDAASGKLRTPEGVNCYLNNGGQRLLIEATDIAGEDTTMVDFGTPVKDLMVLTKALLRLWLAKTFEWERRCAVESLEPLCKAKG